MQKILVITMVDDYPFFMERPEKFHHDGVILVRRIVQTDQQNHSHYLAKTTFIKNLRNKNLVKVEDVIQKSEGIFILYQNVQSKFDWRDPQIITEVYSQLKNLGTYLANIGVKSSLKSNRIGITESGILKYYLGIDFQWDDKKDDEFLPIFYKNQLRKLFGSDFIMKNSQTNYNINQRVNHYSPSTKQKNKQSAHRKVSFATLPSRQNRMANIQKQMNIIKNSFEEREKSKRMLMDSRNMSQSQKNQPKEKISYKKELLLRDKGKLAQKWEDRKFSGDIRNNMMSGRRLEEKQGDIKSQRGAYAPTNRLRQKERNYIESNQQQIQTINSKSRLQQMKYQQYIQIKKSQKNYLKDFISVLQDEQPIFSNNLSHNTSRMTRPTQTSIKIEDTICLTTEALRIKTRQAILNSRKVINKVKGLPSKTFYHQ